MSDPRLRRRWTRRLALGLVPALPLALLVLPWLALSPQPAPAPAPARPWTLTELSRVKAVVGDELRRGGDPQRLLTLTERDLEILVAQAARAWGPARLAVELTTGAAHVRASVAVAPNPLGRWINIDARFNDRGGMPGIDALRVGALAVPGRIADALFGAALQHALATPRGEAALAAEAGGPFADTVGLYKEASDAQGGSGFSFNDLAADRAGTRFGLLAKRAPRLLQALLATGVSERDLMPYVADLPDDLSAQAFASRYGRVGTPEYEAMAAEIEARIDRCRIFDAARGRS